MKNMNKGLINIDLNIDCDANNGCPVNSAAEVIEGKWTTRIVRELLSGTKRFSELQRGLPGISPKILAARLTFLQQKKLVRKKTYPCVPPKTEYRLTPLGQELQPLILAMARFGALLEK